MCIRTRSMPFAQAFVKSLCIHVHCPLIYYVHAYKVARHQLVGIELNVYNDVHTLKASR